MARRSVRRARWPGPGRPVAAPALLLALVLTGLAGCGSGPSPEQAGVPAADGAIPAAEATPLAPGPAPEAIQETSGSTSQAPAPPASRQPADDATAEPAAAAVPALAGASPPAAELAPPERLVVPSIDLDEPLVDLGIAADGVMEVPTDADEVGWFTGGGRPGGFGPTVLAGHVDSDEGPAVFFRLTELVEGDEVIVASTDGTQVRYRVDRVIDVPKGEFPTGDVFGATPGDELRLITCTGAWDSLAQSYEDNRVVFASAVTG